MKRPEKTARRILVILDQARLKQTSMIRHLREKTEWLRDRGVTVDDMHIGKHAVFYLSAGALKRVFTVSISPRYEGRANIKFQCEIERWLRGAS